MQKKLIFLALAVALLIISIKFFPYHCNCGPKEAALPASARTGEVTMGYPTLTIGSNTISVGIADTPALREQGLSGRTELREGTGMLFVFDTPGRYGFWMKDMNFPIDIIWISADMKVVGVEKNARPDSYPKAFYPPSPVKYVLEVPAGYYDAHNLSIGENVVLEK